MWTRAGGPENLLIKRQNLFKNPDMLLLVRGVSLLLAAVAPRARLPALSEGSEARTPIAHAPWGHARLLEELSVPVFAIELEEDGKLYGDERHGGGTLVYMALPDASTVISQVPPPVSTSLHPPHPSSRAPSPLPLLFFFPSLKREKKHYNQGRECPYYSPSLETALPP